ncbi:MAG: DUF115 domain-containing protein [bacterium]|nr:DUF115 domain-containing protein [bacterium]
MVQTSIPKLDPPSKDHLERNLSRFRRTARGLAQAIASADASEVEAVTGPTGESTLSFRGILMASAYDPSADGERLASQIPEGSDLVVALGFGTGHQLEALRKRGARRVLVFEPYLGLLHGALAARPLPLLDCKDVRLSIDEDAMIGQLSEWYSAGLSLHVLVHPGFGRLSPDALRSAVSRIARAKETIDVKSATLRAWVQPWALTAVDNVQRLSGCARIGPLKGAFAGASAVVCAAGPSLTKQLPALAEHRDQLLVIAIGQSLAALEHAGIRPDLVLVTEAQDVTHQFDRVASLGDQNLVLVPQSHAQLFGLPVGRRFIGFEASNPFSAWLGKSLGETEWLRSGGTVAVSAVFLAEFLGAEVVMLIGQDLAFTNDRRYAEGSVYEDLEVEQAEDGSLYFTNLKVKADLFDRPTPDRELAPGALRVEGWYGDEVWTSQSYASFREEFRFVGDTLAREGIRLINCTEGGARIPGLEHEPFGPLVRELAGPTLHADERLAGTLAENASTASVDLAADAVALASAARGLRAEAGRALEKFGRFEGAQRTAAAPSLLRAAAKAERKVHKRLERIPVVEYLAQSELHDLQIASKRDDGSLSGAVARSKALLAALIFGAERVIELMARLSS